MSKLQKHRGKAARGGCYHYSSSHHKSFANVDVSVSLCALALAGLGLLCQTLQAALPPPATAPMPWFPHALLAFFALASVAAVSIKHCKEVAMK